MGIMAAPHDVSSSSRPIVKRLLTFAALHWLAKQQRFWIMRLSHACAEVAPADLTGIVQYHVRLNWDLSDTSVKTQLFDTANPAPCPGCIRSHWVFCSEFCRYFFLVEPLFQKSSG